MDIPLRFNEAQVKLANLIEWFKKHNLPIRIVACKARRAGMSTGVEAYIYHDTTHYPKTNSLIVAHQSKPSENVLKMCSRFWQTTPEIWRPRLPETYKNSPPKDRLEFPDLDSQMFIATARSIDQYLGSGFQNIHATEVAYYKDGQDLFRALDPTLVQVPHSMLVLESTPNGQGNFFHEQCLEAAASARDGVIETGVSRLLFIPWMEMKLSFRLPFESDNKKDAFKASLTKDEAGIWKRYPYLELEQLYWRRSMLRSRAFNQDEERFDQEFPTDLATAFLASGVSVFGRKHIKNLMANTREPVWVGDIYWGDSTAKNETETVHATVRRPRFLTRGEAQASGFKSHVNERLFNNLKVFRWPVKGERVFLAGDVGGGDPETRNGDYSVLQVVVMNDWDADEQIMVWRGHLNPLSFAEVASALSWAIRYRVGDEVAAPMLAIEWNGPGVSCNTYLDKFNLYTPTYRYIQPGIHGQPKSKHIGWESNAKTKPQMVNTMQFMVERELIDIPDALTVQEMSTYQQSDNLGDVSSFGGTPGAHDDCVSALEIAAVLLRFNAGKSAESEVIQILDADDEGGEPWDPFRSHAGSSLFDEDDEDDEDDTDERLFYSGAFS